MEPSSEETKEEPARRGPWAPGRAGTQRGQVARRRGKRPQGRPEEKPQEDPGSPAQRPASETQPPQIRTPRDRARRQKVRAAIALIRTRFGSGSIGLGYSGIRIHEGGHALACIARGGNVGGFRAWLHGVLSFANPPSTNCSIKPIPAAVSAAGPLTSIVAWFTSALIVTLLLNRVFIKRGFWRSVCRACWSFWYISELFNDARHA